MRKQEGPYNKIRRIKYLKNIWKRVTYNLNLFKSNLGSAYKEAKPYSGGHIPKVENSFKHKEPPDFLFDDQPFELTNMDELLQYYPHRYFRQREPHRSDYIGTF